MGLTSSKRPANRKNQYFIIELQYTEKTTQEICVKVSYDYPTTCAYCQLDIEGKNHDTSRTQTLHISLFIDGIGSIPLIIFEEHFQKKNDNLPNVELCQVTPEIVFRYYV